MELSSYKKFSLKFHKKNWSNNRINYCQFELTFACGLHCRHCYIDCYNRPSLVKKQLSTASVKIILDKLFQEGALWLCFTGGDPLARSDFLEIYGYAKKKGFIITIFTNAYSMNKEIAAYLKNSPPFAIEMTLNAVSKDLYERIARVKGSFKKAMAGIDMILKAGLPLKIKTQVTKDNYNRVPQIKHFVEGLGLKFYPDIILNSSLSTDKALTRLRVSLQEAVSLSGATRLSIDDCKLFAERKNHNLCR